MKTFSDKTRVMMLVSANGYCQYQGCYNRATEFHHKMPNTLVNQKLYPLFLQSPFNCLPICSDCHMTKPKIKINESLAAAYEEFLNDLSENTR